MFRANTAALFADGPPATAQRNNLTQSSSFVASNPSTGPAFDESSMQQQPYTATSSVQYAPMKMDPSAVPNGPNATMITTVPLPTPIPRCPPNMINIYGMCKRSFLYYT